MEPLFKSLRNVEGGRENLMAKNYANVAVTFTLSENMPFNQIKILCHPELKPYIEQSLLFLKDALEKKNKRKKGKK